MFQFKYLLTRIAQRATGAWWRNLEEMLDDMIDDRWYIKTQHPQGAESVTSFPKSTFISHTFVFCKVKVWLSICAWKQQHEDKVSNWDFDVIITFTINFTHL